MVNGKTKGWGSGHNSCSFSVPGCSGTHTVAKSREFCTWEFWAGGSAFPPKRSYSDFWSSKDGTNPCLSHHFKRALLKITQESLLGLCSLLCDYYSAANTRLDPTVLYSKSVQVSAIWHLLKTDCILGDRLGCKLFILTYTACLSMLRKS